MSDLIRYRDAKAEIDRLQARVEALEGVLVRAYVLVKLGRYQMADNELRQAIAAAQEKDDD